MQARDLIAELQRLPPDAQVCVRINVDDAAPMFTKIGEVEGFCLYQNTEDAVFYGVARVKFINLSIWRGCIELEAVG